MKYRYTRDELAQFIIEHPLISTETEEFLLDLLFKKKKRGICVPEIRKNTEQMKKLDSEKEFVEIDKLNLNDYVDNLFDRREVSSSTLEVELAIENKINELVNRVNQLSKKK